MNDKNDKNSFAPRIRESAKGREIFDCIRKKFVALTPEEWVRQQIVHFLISDLQIPASHISVETGLTYNDCIYRADIVVYDRRLAPLLIVECKAENININQDTFHQIARYNMALKVPYLFVSNGKQHYFCRFDSARNQYVFEDTMPKYSEMTG